ncbi:carbon starvation CstA family protein [Haloimpatiens lingqiaonensis]|uniref:carbon starvation CstA family protein n=1 Tax=Haloimpatiens lingqiaonensis TaxID=1380675 RepID=UPI0010FDDB54|nr:carbon starvation protein A [Haloimpatiens lingqiaonensis]
MNSIVLILSAIIIFLLAYKSYGGWLLKKWGVEPNRPTPAHTRNDGVDYVPAKAPILLGHHFASIAGAGPIVGPIAAAIFGWVPVFLWIVIGSIFFGGVHDMGSLFTSIRYEGKSVGEVIEHTMGRRGKRLFAIFAWLTLLLVVAAFTNICANTFVSVPSAATSSLLFMGLAVIFGICVYRRGFGLGVSTVVGVILLFVCIWLGMKFPLSLSKSTWLIILLIYIFIASVTPVWILLQPRDYLNSFLLYAMMIGGFIGIVVMHPAIKLAPVTSFNVGGQYLFPMLFVTVACGAISGFHSLVGSGTSSKQLDNERDVKLIGYGSMLIEGVLAVVAIITAAYISKGDLAALLKNGGPVNVFSTGLGTFMDSFGIPFEIGKSFTALAISAFALTSLDTATRLGRFIFQEFFESYKASDKKANPLTNRFVSTAITVVLGGVLTFKGWEAIWPLFGSANQLLAALALLSLAVWLKKCGKEHKMATIPMVFMFAVTLAALGLMIKDNLKLVIAGEFSKYGVLLIFSVLLTILSIVLIVEAIKSLNDKTTSVEENCKG